MYQPISSSSINISTTIMFPTHDPSLPTAYIRVHKEKQEQIAYSWSDLAQPITMLPRARNQQ
jgi:hypothetical protein